VKLHTKVVVITTTTDPAKPDMTVHNAKIEEARADWDISSARTQQEVASVTIHTGSMPFEKKVLIVTTTLHCTKAPSILD